MQSRLNFTAQFISAYATVPVIRDTHAMLKRKALLLHKKPLLVSVKQFSTCRSIKMAESNQEAKTEPQTEETKEPGEYKEARSASMVVHFTYLTQKICRIFNIFP